MLNGQRKYGRIAFFFKKEEKKMCMIEMQKSKAQQKLTEFEYLHDKIIEVDPIT